MKPAKCEVRAVGMEGALKTAECKIEADHIIRYVVTGDAIPRATIQAVLPISLGYYLDELGTTSAPAADLGKWQISKIPVSQNFYSRGGPPSFS